MTDRDKDVQGLHVRKQSSSGCNKGDGVHVCGAMCRYLYKIACCI